MGSLSIKIDDLMKMNKIANRVELSKLLKISQSSLNAVLNGFLIKETNSEKILKKLADFFEISMEDLTCYDDFKSTYISEKDRYHDSLASVLRYLMKDIGGISEGELYRRTGVPQPTIHRILSGVTPNPRNDSAQPLAEFFNVSVDQLLGRVPLPKDRISGSFMATSITTKIVPLLNWGELAGWPSILKQPDFKVERKWITAESGVSDSSFALQITSADYFPEFRKNTIIILDHLRQPKEGDFVLALILRNRNVILGHLSLSDGQKQITSISQTHDNEIVYTDKLISVVGVVCEAKYSF